MNEPIPREEKLQETIAACKELYFRQEQSHLLTYREFLWTQFQHTRKRWWALQALLLAFAIRILPGMEQDFSKVRTTGVIGCLFVMLMIPELWRNREHASTQVEAACFYSLRQVYAARITLFGIVDVALLTLFSLSLGRMGLSLTEVISQFLLPVTVTACICFWFLCGKQNWSETASLAGCLLFGAAWWLLLMNEKIYFMIAPAVWAALLAIALAFLALAVRKTIGSTNQYWEVYFA